MFLTKGLITLCVYTEGAQNKMVFFFCLFLLHTKNVHDNSISQLIMNAYSYSAVLI